MGGCFIAGTKILVPNPDTTTSDMFIEKNIEDIRKGDEVMSFNDELFLWPKKVTTVWNHGPNKVITVKLWNGREITGTSNHFVWSARHEAFAKLSETDTLTTYLKGILPVKEIIEHEDAVPVYNLTVEDNHTYVANGFLVHNMGGGKGGGGGGESESMSMNPVWPILEPLLTSAANKYQQLYSDYYWPTEEIGAQQGLYAAQQYQEPDSRVIDYLASRSDELLGVAADTNPLLDDSRKDLIRRLVEGEDVLADRYRGQAASDTAASFGQQRSQLQDKMSSLGINPSSGAWASSMGNLSNQQALGTANALTNATWNAEDKSLERMTQAQDLYVNPNRLLEQQQPGLNITNLFNSAVGSAPTMTQSSGGGGGGGAGSAMSGIGSMIGAGVGIASMFCDKDLKQNIKEVVSVIDAVECLPIYTYEYKPEANLDSERHIGPMAQDWKELFGGDGKTISYQDAIGVLLCTVKELTARVKQLEGKDNG